MKTIPTRTTRTPLLALVALLATLLAGASLAQVEVTVRQFDPPSEVSALQSAVESFNAERDDIQIDLQNIASGDALNTYVREAQAGGGPDVVHMGLAWVPSLVDSGLLVNLSELADEPIGQGIEDFLATDLTVFDGDVYAVPWTVDTFSIAYRPDAFEAVGIESFPDTWQAFQDAAAQLTRDTSGDERIDQNGFCFSGGAGVNSSIWFLANYHLWSNGGRLVAQQDGTWTVGTDAETLASTMEYFQTFFEEGYTPRALIGSTSFSDPEITSGLARADCAMAFLPPQTFRTADEQADVDLATGTIPAGNETKISHLGGRALGVNPGSEDPEAALEVIRYLTSEGVMAELPQYPAQQSLLGAIDFPAAESGFVDMLPDAVTFKRYTEAPVPLPSLAEATTRQFAAVFSGQKDPTTAAQDLIDEIDELIAQQ